MLEVFIPAFRPDDESDEDLEALLLEDVGMHLFFKAEPTLLADGNG